MEKEVKKRSPEEEHSRQAWLEIWLPLLIGLIACLSILVLVILAAVNGNPIVSQLSSVSIIMMIVPLLFGGLIYLVIAVFIDYGLIKGNKAIPTYGIKIRQKVDSISGTIQSILYSFVTFITKIDSALAVLKSLFMRSKSSTK